MFAYISGAITNNENYVNEFARREKELKELGYNIYNPVKEGLRLRKELGREPTYDEYMKLALKNIDKCDAINFLDNWEQSNGAKIEHEYAIKHNKFIIRIKMLSKNW